METEMRLPRQLYNTIRKDLAQSHPFAGERVGFAFGKLTRSEAGPLVLLYRYMPIPDSWYVRRRGVGACIGGEAIRAVRDDLRSRQGTREGAFHVHVHGHPGEPSFGRTDLESLPRLVPSFFRPGKEGAHGLLLLSDDHAVARVWLPNKERYTVATRVVISGTPLSIFEVNYYE